MTTFCIPFVGAGLRARPSADGFCTKPMATHQSCRGSASRRPAYANADSHKGCSYGARKKTPCRGDSRIARAQSDFPQPNGGRGSPSLRVHLKADSHKGCPYDLRIYFTRCKILRNDTGVVPYTYQMYAVLQEILRSAQNDKLLYTAKESPVVLYNLNITIVFPDKMLYHYNKYTSKKYTGKAH